MQMHNLLTDLFLPNFVTLPTSEKNRLLEFWLFAYKFTLSSDIVLSLMGIALQVPLSLLEFWLFAYKFTLSTEIVLSLMGIA